MKHTKGPWAVNVTGHGSIWIGGNEIGDTGFQTEIGSICSEYGEMSRANGRLIAAAPDLFEALKWVRDNCTGLPAVARALAEKAIAKAEGKS